MSTQFTQKTINLVDQHRMAAKRQLSILCHAYVYVCNTYLPRQQVGNSTMICRNGTRQLLIDCEVRGQTQGSIGQCTRYYGVPSLNYRNRYSLPSLAWHYIYVLKESADNTFKVLLFNNNTQDIGTIIYHTSLLTIGTLSL